MSTQGRLQRWLEDGAEGPAYTLALVAMVARGADAWSAGAINLRHLLGPVGMQVFTGATSVALALGAELTMSVGGRQWRRYSTMAVTVMAEKSLTKAQRLARAAEYRQRARMSKLAALMGAGLSLYAAFFFLANASGGTGGPVLEFMTSLAFVMITGFFGVFKDSREDDPQETARQRGQTLQDRMVDAAADRLADGTHSAADVQLLHAQMPPEHRAAFLAAYHPQEDELWHAADVALWLGAVRGTSEWSATARMVQRALTQAEKAGEMVSRDEHNRFVVPQSLAFRLFAADYVVAHRNVSRDTLATRLRLLPGRAPVPLDATRDSDATATPAS